MAISYSGEGYKFNPQFANLAALQGLQPLDVTRKAEFQLQPLTYAPIPSSRPELVSEGISKGILAAVGGITEGITAKYSAEQKREEKLAERAHEKELAALKAKQYDPYIEALKTRKLELETSAIDKRIEGAVPAGATRRIYKAIDTEPLPESTESTDGNVDLTLTPPEWVSNPDGSTTSIQVDDISANVAEQSKALEGISAKYLTASTDSGIGPIAPIEPVKSMQLGKVSTGLISPEQEKEIQSKFEPYGKIPSVIEKPPQKTLLSIEKAQPKEEVKIKPPRAIDVDTEEEAQAEAYRDIPGFKEGTYTQEIDENGQPFYRVKTRERMSRSEIADLQKKEAEARKATDTGVNFETEKKLRDEYVGQTKDFKTIQSAWRSIKTSGGEPSAAGDMSLIFGYMKLLDPGSTVREGEYANAQNAGGVPDRVVASYNKLLNGQILSDSQRKDFLGQAKKQYDSRRGEYGELKKSYTSLAKEYGLEPKRVVVEFDMPEEITTGQAQQDQISTLSMELEQVPVDQRNSPDFLAKRKVLFDLVKQQEELKKKTQPKPTPTPTPVPQPTFQPAVPRQTVTEYGETIESMFGNR
jgi:hypothetical protein